MVLTASSAFVGTLTLLITVYLAESVSPDLGAPDSNNLNMEFSPDDSAAGGADTSLDNNNATPLMITTPIPTPSTVTTTTSSTRTPATMIVKLLTTSARLTPSAVNTYRIPTATTTAAAFRTTTTMTTSKLLEPQATMPAVTMQWLNPTISVSSPGHNPYNGPAQYPHSGNKAQETGWINSPQGSPYPQGQHMQGQHLQGQLSRGRHNVPWWWLLMEEV